MIYLINASSLVLEGKSKCCVSAVHCVRLLSLQSFWLAKWSFMLANIICLTYSSNQRGFQNNLLLSPDYCATFFPMVSTRGGVIWPEHYEFFTGPYLNNSWVPNRIRLYLTLNILSAEVCKVCSHWKVCKTAVYYSRTQNSPKIECGMMDTSRP